MSTHALTCYLTREYDGQTVAEVGHFYRKFDGEPATHAAELKDLVGDQRFQTLWDLVAVVTKLSAAAGGASYNWMFVPVDPHTDAEYKYFLSLVDENGEMPHGGACEAEFDVHLKVQRRGQTLYSGLLRRYVPEEELETDAEIDAGEGGAGDRSRPGRGAHEGRKAIVSRVLAFLSRDGRIPWLTSGSREIRGKEPVLDLLHCLPDDELHDLDKGLAAGFGERYSRARQR